MVNNMNGLYYYWNCTNQECESWSKVERALIDKVKLEGKNLHLFCQICGFSPDSVRLDLHDISGQKINACDCIPFKGEESRLPLRRTSDGYYVDVNGHHDPIKTFYDMGIDPDAYLQWVKYNKPRDIDLRKA